MSSYSPSLENDDLDDWALIRSSLDEELIQLPDRYLDPIVLCDLVGFTFKEAARELSTPAHVVEIRLAQSHDILRHRFLRRGIPLSSHYLGKLISANGSTWTPSIQMKSFISTAMERISLETISEETLSENMVSFLQKLDQESF
jgi:hypothetical protein